MKFLIDAHLPRGIVTQLKQAGQEAIHTRDLTLGNRTPDSVINQLSITEQRIVVTKDADFMGSHILKGEPYRLLLISTGNINNKDLLKLIEQNLHQIVEAFYPYISGIRHLATYHSFVKLNPPTQ